jgi:hypothetical protein
MSRFAYEFTGRVAKHSFGNWGYTVVFLPPELAAQLPLAEHPRLRVRGEMDDYPFYGAWQPTGGQWYLMINKSVLKQGGYQLGDWINVRFNIDDQDAVDLPEALEAALKSDRKFRAAWDQLTAGKQRGFAYQVSTAKTAPTIEKRVLKVKELVLNL